MLKPNRTFNEFINLLDIVNRHTFPTFSYKRTKLIYLVCEYLRELRFIYGYSLFEVEKRKLLTLHIKYYHNKPLYRRIIPLSVTSSPKYFKNRALLQLMRKKRDAFYIVSTVEGIMSIDMACTRGLGAILIAKILF